MNRYVVTVKEVLAYDVEVEAESEAEARIRALEKIEDENPPCDDASFSYTLDSVDWNVEKLS